MKNYANIEIPAECSLEVFELTVRNHEIVNRFSEVAKGFVDGLIFSGSSAWGAYHSVTKKSDIDLLFISNDIDRFGELIDVYIKNGMVDPKEEERFKVYKKLYCEKKAEQYSTAFVYPQEKIEIDFNFIPTDVAKRICYLEQMGVCKTKGGLGEINIRTIKEFRSVVPKIGGYCLADMTGRRRVTYEPRFEVIKNSDQVDVGYIAESAVDAESLEEKGKTYFLGVWSFFFLIYPLIMIDKSEELKILVDCFRSKISTKLNGKRPEYIIRQERMSEETLNKIKDSFVTS